MASALEIIDSGCKSTNKCLLYTYPLFGKPLLHFSDDMSRSDIDRVLKKFSSSKVKRFWFLMLLGIRRSTVSDGIRELCTGRFAIYEGKRTLLNSTFILFDFSATVRKVIKVSASKNFNRELRNEALRNNNLRISLLSPVKTFDMVSSGYFNSLFYFSQDYVDFERLCVEECKTFMREILPFRLSSVGAENAGSNIMVHGDLTRWNVGRSGKSFLVYDFGEYPVYPVVIDYISLGLSYNMSFEEILELVPREILNVNDILLSIKLLEHRLDVKTIHISRKSLRKFALKAKQQHIRD